MSSVDLHDHYKRTCAGLISSWVARPKRPISTVAKTVVTIARKEGITPAELTEAVQEVRELSVDTFGPDRLERFRQLTSVLRQEGVL